MELDIETRVSGILLCDSSLRRMSMLELMACHCFGFAAPLYSLCRRSAERCELRLRLQARHAGSYRIFAGVDVVTDWGWEDRNRS